MTDDEQPVASSGGPSPWVLNVSVAVLCLIWGSTWLVIKEGLRDLPPLTSAATRFLAAGVLFIPLTAALRGREGGVNPGWRLSTIMAVFCFAVPYGTLYWVETRIPSGLASVLWALFPMALALIGSRVLAEQQLSGRNWFGFILGFAGVAVLFVTDLRTIGAEAVGAGLIYLSSPIVAAYGNAVVKRDAGQVSSLALNRNGLLGGSVLLWLTAWITEADAPIQWTNAAIASVVYLTLIGTVLAFGLYFWLLRYAKAHKLALIAYVVPALALLLGWGLGDESLGSSTVAGTALILLGVRWVVR